MTTHIKPAHKPAVTYSQDALYDYAKLGGSVESLFAGEIQAGNRIIVIQEPVNAPSEVAIIIETMEDFARWKESRLKMREWLGKIFEQT